MATQNSLNDIYWGKPDAYKNTSSSESRNLWESPDKQINNEVEKITTRVKQVDLNRNT